MGVKIELEQEEIEQIITALVDHGQQMYKAYKKSKFKVDKDNLKKKHTMNEKLFRFFTTLKK